MALHVFIIDDHAMFRSGLALLLRMSIADVRVTEAGTIAEALQWEESAPDVLLLDMRLHGMSGLDGLPLVKRKWPQAAVIVLSSDTALETEMRAREEGAVAFVSKEQTADEMLSAIQNAIRADLPPQAQPSPDAPAGVQNLTPRQYEVLDLLSQGLPNKAIGRRLGLSENTVRGHVQAILTALNVTNRGEAACIARRRGLVH